MLGNVGNLGILSKFFFLSFRFGVLGQNRKVGREKVRKKFLRFPMFPRFWLGYIAESFKMKFFDAMENLLR